jgi:hypothetical protein
MKCKKVLKLAAVSVLLLAMSATAGKGDNVRWRDIIGIVEAGNVVGKGTVGGFTSGIPGGAPWSTLSGGAKVNLSNGQVQFEVKGLVLAAGSASALGITALPIGTTGGIPEVIGTLVCNVGPPNSTGNSASIDTPAVPLSATGDAKFSGKFSDTIPDACTSAPDNMAFLLRIAGTGSVTSGGFDGVWIASGAVLDR